jgi:hypothetical protein
MLSKLGGSLSKMAKAANPMNAVSGDSAYYSDLNSGVARAEMQLLDWGITLYVQFNPNKLTITRGAPVWGKPQSTGSGLRVRHSDKLTADLLFDASEEKGKEGDGGGSILNWINNFKQLTEVREFSSDKDKGKRPPVILFSWGDGDALTFAGAISELSYDITMFNGKGQPMRATVKMTMQGELMPKANPKVADIINGDQAPEKDSAGKGAIDKTDPKSLTQD